MRRAWIATCLGAVVLGSSGCSSIGKGLSLAVEDVHECIDESMVDYRNRAMAEKAWIRIRHQYHDYQYHRDFKNGFVAGYLNVAGGGNGCTPTTAPSQYWGWRYQSSAGQAAVNAWFQGFPLGAKAAEQDGVANWRDINIRLRTPAPLDLRALETGGLPPYSAPYIEDAEVIPAPLPAPGSNGPRSNSPSEMPWEDEISDPEREIETPGVEFNLQSTRAEDSTLAEVEIAARSPEDQATELLEPRNTPQEFTDEFVNELFGAPVDVENDAGSTDLPFTFE